MIRLLARFRVRDERGVSLVELLTVMMLLSVVLAVTATIMATAQKTGNLGRSESFNLDEARNAAAQIQRDVRNAVAVASCAPTGYCLQLYAQQPNGAIDQVKLRAVQAAPPAGATVVYRDSGCDSAFANCSTTRALISTLKNNAQSKAVFTCVASTTLPRIDLELIVTPLASSGSGSLTVQSSARPRNVTTAFC